jgi:hypothetical protein
MREYSLHCREDDVDQLVHNQVRPRTRVISSGLRASIKHGDVARDLASGAQAGSLSRCALSVPKDRSRACPVRHDQPH